MTSTAPLPAVSDTKNRKEHTMNAKNTLTALGSALALTLTTSTGALAAGAGHKVYSSGILVLVFLGFCALVVVAQLIPALITLCGLIKGALASRKGEEAVVRTK